MKRYTTALLLIALCGCAQLSPPRDNSAQQRIDAEMKLAATPAPKQQAAVPQAISDSLLPPLGGGVRRVGDSQLEPRFDLVVAEAPIQQVFMAIVADTRYSILVSPKTTPPTAHTAGAAEAQPVTALKPELVTVTLKDVTVFEALDAIREMFGYEYTVDGTRIYVRPPQIQTRLYNINYVLGQRRGVSDMQVIGGASGGSNGSGGSSGSSGSNSNSGTTSSGGGSSYSSIQASALSTISKSDVWAEIEDAVRTSLGCSVPRSQASRGGTTGAGTSSSSSSSSSNASRADVSFVGDTQSGERLHGVDGCTEGRAMSINQMSGTVLVRAMPSEHRQIQRMLRTMQVNIERQVIIEAKIIDVTLNTDAQQGINWAAFNSAGLHRFSVGANPNQLTSYSSNNPTASGTGSVSTTNNQPGQGTAGTTLGDLLGATMLGQAANAFSAGLGIAVQTANFAALINFMQTQGQVHVLSSPRIATLNNQKAVIKVGTEEPYVTNISPATTVSNNSTTNVVPPSLVYQPFFSGVALDVTPQIDENYNITLHVHSMVNNIVQKNKISLPSPNAAMVPFAVNSISETDSLVRTKDGYVVVIGGLMTEGTIDERGGVPGVSAMPLVGTFFRNGTQQSLKRELVILLKPTVVRDEAAWIADITAAQGRIEKFNASAPPLPLDTPPPSEAPPPQ